MMRLHRRRASKPRNIGLERALQHIEEAKEFSREIGGSDSDVKAYFFGLSQDDLDRVLTEYGRRHGADARKYAETAFHQWRRGTKRMSGVVAKRLFGLLPPMMPFEQKTKLAEDVWLHFGPRSSRHFRIGSEAPLEDICNRVTEGLRTQVTDYVIPDDVARRFEWLSAGDIKVKEQLLNHFRSLERDLAISKLAMELPLLQQQVRDHNELTKLAKIVVRVHRHEFTVSIDPKLTFEVLEVGVLLNSISTGRQDAQSSITTGGLQGLFEDSPTTGCIVFIVGWILAVLLLANIGKVL